MSVWPSTHFLLQQLAPGVYAAIQRDDGWAIGNAGIVDLGGETLVFDSTMTPAAGGDLRAAAEGLFDRPVSYLVNSHYHNDHVWGNQAFDPATPIIADSRTAALFDSAGRKEVETFSAIAADRRAALQAELEAAPDAAARAAIAPWLTYFTALVATMPTLLVRRPDIAFTGSMTFTGSSRTARLLNFAGGHTPSDSVLYLPEDGILFAADLLFVETHPYLADGSPDALLAITAELAALEAQTVVPGHGPVGTTAHFAVQRAYVAACRAAAEALLAAGQTPDELQPDALPARFRGWMLGRFFAANVFHFYRLLLAPD